MKKLIFVIFFILNFAFASFADELDRTMSISVSPIALAFGRLDALYQLNLYDYLSLTFPGHFAYNWAAAPFIELLDQRFIDVKNLVAPIDFGGGVGAKFLFAKAGLVDSIYFEPRVQIGYSRLIVEMKGEDNKLGWDLIKLSPTVRFGWDWYFDSGVNLSLGGGLGYDFFLKNTVLMPALMVDNFFGKFTLPSEDSLGQIAWDLEFKVGYTW